MRFLSLTILMACMWTSDPARAAAQTVFRKGNVEVRESVARVDREFIRRYSLIRGRINFGTACVEGPHRRRPGTYYFPEGPVGLAFRSIDPLKLKSDFFRSDVRIAASLVGLAGVSPEAAIVAAWTELPVAVVGMNAGTTAAYARPFQPFHFYESDPTILALNREGRYFPQFKDAKDRGAGVVVFEGPTRKTLRDRGPRGFYKLMILEACSGEDLERIAIDHFTREAIAECMKTLREDGVLCVHTSHRFLKLPPVLKSIADDLKLIAATGHDEAPDRQDDHFTSEWVMISRDKKAIESLCVEPVDYKKRLQRAGAPIAPFWSTPAASGKVWTDDGPRPLDGVLRGHPFRMRLEALTYPIEDFLGPAFRSLGLEMTLHEKLHDAYDRMENAARIRTLNAKTDLRDLWK